MNKLSELLSRLADAFLDAQGRPVEQTDASSGRTYAALFEQTFAERLPPKEWSYFVESTSAREEALHAARQGRLDASHKLFADLRADAAAARVSRAARILVDIFLNAGDAYLQYRLGCYDRAEELIRLASALDDQLATEFGFEIMCGHRLQLGQNLIRIQARRKQRCQAVGLAAAFLNYLERRVESVPTALASPRDCLDCVPESVLEHYFDRICAEAALLLAGHGGAEVEPLFEALVFHAEPANCVDSSYGRQAHGWLRCKALALHGPIDAYLAAATDLIGAGRMSEPLLWFAAIIDVVGVSRTIGPEAARLADWLAGEASSLADAPYAMRKAAGKI